MKENPALEKSFAFALRVVRLYKYLCEEKSEQVLSKSALVAGTNVGRHVKAAAASGASSPAFAAEMAAALTKAAETEYWLELLRAADYLEEKPFVSISADCRELIGILTAIVETSKKGD